MSELPDISIIPPTVSPPQGVDLQAFTLAYLEAHDAECPACGYNVRALQVPRCPECGAAVVLRVTNFQTGYTAAWILATLATALAGGIGCFLVAVLLHERLPRRTPWAIVFSYFIANIPASLLLLFCRRWLVRLPGPLQWIGAALITAATVGMLAWFVWMIQP
ncbi:MAG TPA: hypothetical protein VHM90_03930 [Phycisphaerae bacterium]|jgi:hypothetical protein|nr:hypothetical protein [Phycisphaerae bacterium]